MGMSKRKIAVGTTKNDPVSLTRTQMEKSTGDTLLRRECKMIRVLSVLLIDRLKEEKEGYRGVGEQSPAQDKSKGRAKKRPAFVVLSLFRIATAGV